MKKISFIFIGLMVMALTSCVKPYDKPEYVNVGTNETAFVIPLFTDDDVKTDDQVIVNSEAYYNKNKLNEKLVQIPHKWVKTGRWARSGYYTATLKVVTVSNSPVSGTWEKDIKVETKGSQGITVPMKYTIRVEPQNAAKFLAKFPADTKITEDGGRTTLKSKMTSSVTKVADSQFKDYVAGILSEEFHKYEYQDVNNNRDVIIAAGIARIREWAETYGITIDNIAVFDGLNYEDKTLQNAIDEQAKLAAETETEKKRQQKLAQEKQNEIELAKLEKQKLAIDRENETYKAKTQVEVNNIVAQNYKVEMDKKLKEQEIENLKLKGKAEAEAIITKAGKFAMPSTLVITPELASAFGLGEIIRQ